MAARAIDAAGGHELDQICAAPQVRADRLADFLDAVEAARIAVAVGGMDRACGRDDAWPGHVAGLDGGAHRNV
jgi:hypothetical protein